MAELPFLLEGATTHRVAQERPGAFTLTPRGASDESWDAFQSVLRDIDIAERDGLIKCIRHRTGERDGVDLVFVVLA